MKQNAAERQMKGRLSDILIRKTVNVYLINQCPVAKHPFCFGIIAQTI